MKNTVLFVYGTLKKGEVQELCAYKPTPRFIGEGWMKGRLYDLGHCPGLVLDSGGVPVWGEVYELDEALFEDLDRWEAECGDFVLREGVVYLADRPIQASVYVLGPRQALPPDQIVGGRWTTQGSPLGQLTVQSGEGALYVDLPARLVAPSEELVAGVVQSIRALKHPEIATVLPDGQGIHVQLTAPLGHGGAMRVRDVLNRVQLGALESKIRHHVVPVCFARELGVDLAEVAARSGMSVEALVGLLSSQAYTVTGDGTRPAFRHLKGVPRQVQSIRRPMPRAGVAAGTLVLLDGYCGLCPEKGPASWNMVGRTPLAFGREQARRLQPGDTVQFTPVSLDDCHKPAPSTAECYENIVA